MPRIARLVIKEEKAVYHVMSRTALDGYVLGDVEKDFLVNHIRWLAKVYFAEVLGFCIMGNHFHLLVRMHPNDGYTDKNIQERVNRFYAGDKIIHISEVEKYRHKLGSLSEFVAQMLWISIFKAISCQKAAENNLKDTKRYQTRFHPTVQ